MAIDYTIRGLALKVNATSDPGIQPELVYSFTNATEQTWRLARISAAAQGSFGGQLVVETNAGGGTPGETTIERLRIDNNGNIGIGTTSPATKLEVVGDWTGEDGALRLTGDKPTVRFSGGALSGNQSWILHLGGNGPGNLEFYRRTGPSQWSSVMVLAPTGNVGIGTTSPNTKLDVAGNLQILTGSNPIRFTAGWTNFPGAVTNQAEISNDTSSYKTLMIVGNRSAGLGRRVSVWDRLEVNGTFITTGNVGIGTTNPAFQLSLGSSTARTKLALYETGASNSYGLGVTSGTFRLHLNGDQARFAFFNNDEENAREIFTIRGSGNVGFGVVNPAYKLDVAGSALATSFSTSSDERFKREVQPLTRVLEKLEKIRGISFEWNGLYESLGRSTERREIGVIGQEVEAVFPELVTTWGDESYKAIDYGSLTAVLIEAIKELKAETAALKQRIEAL